jgi:hypothetical protein
VERHTPALLTSIFELSNMMASGGYEMPELTPMERFE